MDYCYDPNWQTEPPTEPPTSDLPTGSPTSEAPTGPPTSESPTEAPTSAAPIFSAPTESGPPLSLGTVTPYGLCEG